MTYFTTFRFQWSLGVVEESLAHSRVFPALKALGMTGLTGLTSNVLGLVGCLRPLRRGSGPHLA